MNRIISSGKLEMWRPSVTITPGAVSRLNRCPFPLSMDVWKRCTKSTLLKSSTFWLSSFGCSFFESDSTVLDIWIVVFDFSYILNSISGSIWTARRYILIASNTFPFFSNSTAAKNNASAYRFARRMKNAFCRKGLRFFKRLFVYLVISNGRLMATCCLRDGFIFFVPLCSA